jgi:hypothetical protein
LLCCLACLIGGGRLRVGLGGRGDGGVAIFERGVEGLLGSPGGGGALPGVGFSRACAFLSVARQLLGGVQCGEGVVAFSVGAVQLTFGVAVEALGGLELAARGALYLGRLGEGVGKRIDVGELGEVGVDALGGAVSSATVAARSSWASVRSSPPASCAAS